MVFSWCGFVLAGMTGGPFGFAQCCSYGLTPEQTPRHLAFPDEGFDTRFLFVGHCDHESFHRRFSHDGSMALHGALAECIAIVDEQLASVFIDN